MPPQIVEQVDVEGDTDSRVHDTIPLVAWLLDNMLEELVHVIVPVGFNPSTEAVHDVVGIPPVATKEEDEQLTVVVEGAG